MEYFAVYNQYGERTDEIVGRNEAHRNGTCHRSVHLWIINSNNEVLIQQRSANKDAGANLWYVSVAGHMIHSESIEDTLIRETKEELGLDISSLTDSISYLFTFHEIYNENNGNHIDNEFLDVFALRADFEIKEIMMQEEEVQAVKYMSYEDFKQIIMNRDQSFWHHEVGYKMLLTALDHFCKLQP